MENEQRKVNTEPLAQVKLTEDQVKHALAEYLMKNDEFKSMVDGKKILLTTNWHTTKWSDPEVLAVCAVFEVIEEQSSDDASN
tara:strand:+ start:974 stop:1222 length:249 start_codon:yes stop_codon:yes gene_type:complete